MLVAMALNPIMGWPAHAAGGVGHLVLLDMGKSSGAQLQLWYEAVQQHKESLQLLSTVHTLTLKVSFPCHLSHALVFLFWPGLEPTKREGACLACSHVPPNTVPHHHDLRTLSDAFS